MIDFEPVAPPSSSAAVSSSTPSFLVRPLPLGLATFESALPPSDARVSGEGRGRTEARERKECSANSHSFD